MKIPIIKTGGYLPKYATQQSAGCDLKAIIDSPIVLKPLERVTVPTGIKIQLPQGYEAQVRGRSGLTAKNGLVVPVGTIDADYIGEIYVTVFNLSLEEQVISTGMRLAQLVVSKIKQAEWTVVKELVPTLRGEGGHGSTGVD